MLELLKKFDQGESLSNSELIGLHNTLEVFTQSGTFRFNCEQLGEFEATLIKSGAYHKLNIIEDILTVRGITL